MGGNSIVDQQSCLKHTCEVSCRNHSPLASNTLLERSPCNFHTHQSQVQVVFVLIAIVMGAIVYIICVTNWSYIM